MTARYGEKVLEILENLFQKVLKPPEAFLGKR